MRLCLLLVALVAFAGCSSATPPPFPVQVPTVTAQPTVVPSTPTPFPAPFRVIGYITDWGVPVLPEQIEQLTHVNYAFALPKEDGTLDLPPNGWRLQQYVQTAHASHVQVLISVGGWGYDKQFEAFAASPEKRAIFVQAVMDYVDTNQLDGVDIDWEYPKGGASSDNYLALMRELRAQADARKKLLTTAVAAYGDNAAGIPDETFGLTDFVNVMAYADSGAHHSPYDLATRALDYWQGRGVTQDKLVLGVPFYASPGDVPYRKIVASDSHAAQTDETRYLGSAETYNGLPTMRAKTKLALERASGIMIWSINDDAVNENSLLKAIHEITLAPRK